MIYLLVAARSENFNPEMVRDIFLKYGLKTNSSRNLYNRMDNNLSLFYYLEDYLEESVNTGKFTYGSQEYSTIKEFKYLPLMNVLTQLTRSNPSGYVLNHKLELVKG